MTNTTTCQANPTITGRLDPVAHGDLPWRVHEITGDFDLEDVWRYPIVGGRDDFAQVVSVLTQAPIVERSGPVFRTLWAARWALGRLLRWDRAELDVGTAVPSIRARLPADLRDVPTGPQMGDTPMRSVYLLPDEFVTELANSTCHAVMHLGWTPIGAERWALQMAVLVKPRGRFGAAYMAAIAPIRHVIVYPRMLATCGRIWQEHLTRLTEEGTP